MSSALPFPKVNKLHKMLLNLLSQAWTFHCRAADSVQSRTSRNLLSWHMGRGYNNSIA